MGLWGASQAVGFALGGVLGAAASDLARLWAATQVQAYVVVFAAESLMFVAAAALALAIRVPAALPRGTPRGPASLTSNPAGAP